MRLDQLASWDALSSVAGQVGVYARRLSSGEASQALEHDAEVPFRAASVIKVGIMAALLADVEAGRLCLSDTVEISKSEMVEGAGVLFELDPGRSYTLRELCRLMIVVSDNTASNALLRAVGVERLNTFLKERGYEASIDRFFMHPVIDGRDNFMSARSAAEMLADLYLAKGFAQSSQEFAKGCLRGQQYREKIPLMLPEELLVGHKTGELDGVRHDAAVVECPEPYLLVVFTQEGGAPWEVDRAIARFSLELYEQRTVLFGGAT